MWMNDDFFLLSSNLDDSLKESLLGKALGVELVEASDSIHVVSATQRDVVRDLLFRR